MRTLAGATIALGMLLGCGTSAGKPGDLPEPFTHATAMPDCAPWDGAAVSILFTTHPFDSTRQVNGPHMRLYVWQELDELKSASFEWPEDAQWGASSWCQDAENCEAASSGTVQFQGFSPDSILAGQFDLRFPGRGRVAGQFRAGWFEQRLMCG